MVAEQVGCHLSPERGFEGTLAVFQRLAGLVASGSCSGTITLDQAGHGCACERLAQVQGDKIAGRRFDAPMPFRIAGHWIFWSVAHGQDV